ncbi:MAG: hypothetical protein ACKOZX_05325 [Gammaproteobacteria bacterium]
MATHPICLYRADGIALELPLVSELASDFGFPLVEDPRRTERAVVIGMFVTRPLLRAWRSPVLTAAGHLDLGSVDQLVASVRGAEGGGVISGGHPFDAERLAVHYGLVDAVLVGSGTVFAEGFAPGHEARADTEPVTGREAEAAGASGGYIWQDYTPLSWPQLSSRAATVGAGIQATRAIWQRMGVLSARDRPAQIVVTESGRQATDGRHLWDAAIFAARHPDGSPIETYVLTSETGARRLLTDGRARGRHLEDRLLVISSPGAPDRIDVAALPTMLRARLDIRLANHDGGRTALAAFVRAKAVAQLNLTIMRQRSLLEQIRQDPRLTPAQRATLLRDLSERCEFLFPGVGGIPAHYRPLQLLSYEDDLVVATLATHDVSPA